MSNQNQSQFITTSDEQQRQNKRLEELEKKPVKRWDAVIDKIVMTVLGALIAYVLLQAGLTPS